MNATHTIAIHLDDSQIMQKLHETRFSLLLLLCKRYSAMSDGCKRGPVGKALYSRMKSLNEKVLAHD